MTPDFIIGGAPKCGTTSLHQILHQHPDAWMARNEVYYFDADDPIAHGDFLSVEGGELNWSDPEDPGVAAWYEDRFARAPEGSLIGEDTTTYLMSPAAPARIGAKLPEAKMLFMLRDPVKRAHSQYWHLVRSGRTHLPFEEALSVERSIVLGSTYAPALRRFLEELGPERVHVVLFEDFNRDRQAVMNGVTDFLGLERMTVEDVESWYNRTRYPRNTRRLLQLNRVGRHLVKYRYARHFGPGAGLRARAGHRLYRRWFDFVADRVLTEDRPEKQMQERTRRFLARHLSDRNAGLSQLLGRDLSILWPGFTQ